MEDREPSRGRHKATTYLFLISLMLILCLGTPSDPYSSSPYLWRLRDGITGEIVTTYQGVGQPVFVFDLCHLWGKGFDPTWGGAKYACRDLRSSKIMTKTQLYGCPSSGPRECQGNGQYHCAQWSCVSFAPWTKIDPFITFTHQPQSDCRTYEACNNVTIKVLSGWHPLNTITEWDTGLTWGLRAYVPGYDPGILFTIQRTKKMLTTNPIGPNKPLQRPPRPHNETLKAS